MLRAAIRRDPSAGAPWCLGDAEVKKEPSLLLNRLVMTRLRPEVAHSGLY